MLEEGIMISSWCNAEEGDPRVLTLLRVKFVIFAKMEATLQLTGTYGALCLQWLLDSILQ